MPDNLLVTRDKILEEIKARGLEEDFIKECRVFAALPEEVAHPGIKTGHVSLARRRFWSLLQDKYKWNQLSIAHLFRVKRSLIEYSRRAIHTEEPFIDKVPVLQDREFYWVRMAKATSPAALEVGRYREGYQHNLRFPVAPGWTLTGSEEEWPLEMVDVIAGPLPQPR